MKIVLHNNPCVISNDGFFIGMKRFIPEAFSVPSWGGGDVLHATREYVKVRGLTCALADTLPDIDTPEGIDAFLSGPPSRGRATRAAIRSGAPLSAHSEKNLSKATTIISSSSSA